MRSRISARCHGGSGSCITRSAASIARRASCPPARAIVAKTSPECGDRTSKDSPVSSHSPAR